MEFETEADSRDKFHLFEIKFEADCSVVNRYPHDDRPRPYLCTICDRRFIRKGHLNRHKLLHGKERQFLCNVCDKQFTRKERLKFHQKTHAQETVHSCDPCKKQCPSQLALSCHMNIHTGKYDCTPSGR